MSEQKPTDGPVARPGDSRNIVLTGFMGVGKTTVGRILARKLRRGFLDTDAIITERHGPITDIFARDGEDGFRDIERGVAAELGRQRGLVVATGGRLMLDPANIESLNRTGHVFALAATPAQIWSRVNQGNGIAKRPLLAGPDPLGKITQLLAERGPKYHLFPQVAAGVRRADDVAAEIIELHQREPTNLVAANRATRAIVGINLLAHLHPLLSTSNQSPDSTSPQTPIAGMQHHARLASLISHAPAGVHALVGTHDEWQVASHAARQASDLTVHCVTDHQSISATANAQGDPLPDVAIVDLAIVQPDLPEYHDLRDAWDRTVSTFVQAGWTIAESVP